MKLEYQLLEDDYLKHLLFEDSKNGTTKKAGRKTAFMMLLAFFGIGYILFHSERIVAYFFFGVGVFNFIVYPFYLKKHQKKQYQSYIQRIYKYTLGRVVNVCLTESQIEQNDSSGEFKFNLTELENIMETQMHFYLKMRSSGSLIIPKNKIGDQAEQVKNEMKVLANRMKVGYTEDLNWKW
jgi:YcxB-like protein